MSEVRYHQFRGNEIVEQAKRLGAYLEQHSFVKRALHVATVAISVGSLAAMKYMPDTEPGLTCTPGCHIGPITRTTAPEVQTFPEPLFVPTTEVKSIAATVPPELETQQSRTRLKSIFQQSIEPRLVDHK